jgi:hypothetical protein
LHFAFLILHYCLFDCDLKVLLVEGLILAKCKGFICFAELEAMQETLKKQQDPE